MNLFTMIIISGLLSFVHVTASAEEVIHCPAKLSVNQSIVGSLSGWQLYNSNRSHSFVNVSFSEGPPNKQCILVPTQERKVKGTLVAEWILPASTEGYWVSCVYNETSATVARKLPENIAYCAAEYDKHFSQPVVKRWYCGNKQVRQK